MKKTRKALLLGVCAVLLVTASVLGTIAYLTDKTETITNTFTVGNVDIDLKETKNDFKMVPGNTIDKDPKVTVEAGSEDCYLFVKLEKSANFDTYLTYEMAEGWTALENVSGVYYRNAKAGDNFSVLKNDKVTVKSEVTTEQMNVAETTMPTLTITAYACQSANVADAATAWAQVQPAVTPAP